MSQFLTWIDRDGNLLMNGGTVQCFHGTTDYFPVGDEGGEVVVPASAETRDGIRAAASAGTSMQGGSGRNANVSGSTAGTLVPMGFFRPIAPDAWTGPRGAALTFDSGDGSAELHDGTDVLATLAPGATIAPYGTFNSTPYGTALNGSVPFTFDVNYEGSPTTFPARPAFFQPYAGTAQEGSFTRTGWQAWESDVDPSWTISIDGLGEGSLSDGTDIVATRAADANLLYDPSGSWAATLYGMATYYASEVWGGNMVLGGAFTQVGKLYVELVLDAVTNEVTAVNGPFFATSPPPNTATLACVLIAASNGAGKIHQIQEGPIYWRPNP